MYFIYSAAFLEGLFCPVWEGISEGSFTNSAEAQEESTVGTGLGGVFQGTIEILGDTLT